jgi:hypothetical protein
MLSRNKLKSYWMNKEFCVKQPLCLCSVLEVLEGIVNFNVHRNKLLFSLRLRLNEKNLRRFILVMFSLTTLCNLHYILLWYLIILHIYSLFFIPSISIDVSTCLFHL